MRNLRLRKGQWVGQRLKDLNQGCQILEAALLTTFLSWKEFLIPRVMHWLMQARVRMQTSCHLSLQPTPSAGIFHGGSDAFICEVRPLVKRLCLLSEGRKPGLPQLWFGCSYSCQLWQQAWKLWQSLASGELASWVTVYWGGHPLWPLRHPGQYSCSSKKNLVTAVAVTCSAFQISDLPLSWCFLL